ncbi:glycosyltransferase [Mixta calida]|uniref:glycosyltransferase n=1 Tax=Mixta calida TaxID=665913 RepID=UPI00403B1E68
MRNKKIIIAGYDLSGFGGMETVCDSFVRLLRQSHPHLTVNFVFFKEGNTQVDDTWLAQHNFTRLFSGVRNTKIRRLCFAWSFARVLRNEKADIVLCLDSLSCFIASNARKFIFRKLPIYSWVHFSTHNMYKAKYICKADAHLSISTVISQQLRDMGISSEKIFTVHNPVGSVDRTIPRPAKVTRFLYVGRIIADEQKNMRGLFQALSQIKGFWELEIIGAGEDMALLQALAESLNISDRITWHGWQKQPWLYIQEEIKYITCLLLTSHYEGFGMVLAEASANGVYAISSDCKTGPADIIKQNINGNLYPVEQPEQLVKLLQEIVNGKSLPDHFTIKSAIADFYEDKYIAKMLKALELN